MLENFKTTQPIGYKILKKLENNRHFAHAYLIETNGFDGGYDFAITLAKIILGNDENISNMIDNNNYPELKIISSKDNWIKKEQLIELQNEFSKKAVLGNNKVYIINGAEKLNVSASNTILKFLEEPEEGVTAILITDNLYQLLETIISRCQIISLNGQVKTIKKNSTIEKVCDILSNNSIEYNELLNDEKTKEKLEAVIKFVTYYEKHRKKVLLYMNEYWFNFFNDKENISKALLIIIYFYKDLLNVKLNNTIDIFEDYLINLQELSKLNTVDKIIDKISIINENRNYLENNANLNLLMDRIIIEVDND